MAGLNGLYPKPPYKCLAMIIAKKIPTKIIHHGISGGRVSANSHAVTIALKSLRNGSNGRLRMIKAVASSVTANTIEIIT